MNGMSFKPSNVSLGMFLLSMVLIGISFILPNELNNLSKSEIWNLMVQNPGGFLSLYALMLIPVALVLLYFNRMVAALHVSWIIMLFQVFASPFYRLDHWYEYLVYLLGLAFTLVVYHRIRQSGFYRNRAYAIGSGIYFLFLFGLSLFAQNFDSEFFFALFFLLGYMLFSSIGKLTKRLFLGLLLAYYAVLLVALLFNLNCYKKYTYDMRIADWTISTIYNRCSSFIITFLGTLCLNYASLLNYKHNNNEFEES